MEASKATTGNLTVDLQPTDVNVFLGQTTGEYEERLAAKQLRLAVTDAAKQMIVDGGYDPVYGARPLKRYIQQKVETLVARDIIQNDPAPGDTITVDVKDGALALV